MLLKGIVCSIVLIAILKLMAVGLNGVFADYGFAVGMAVCAVSCLALLAWGWFWDRSEARHSQAEQPPEPPYSRTIDL
jgi:uncharacterized membrane protein YqjE